MSIEKEEKKLTLAEIEAKMSDLASRIHWINDWIRSNPSTDPNAHEIMDCNVQYAEVFAELIKFYTENGWPMLPTDSTNGWPNHVKPADLPKLHPALGSCFLGLCTMDSLRDLEHHPFFITNEANSMYAAVRTRGLAGTYILPEKEEDRRIKRELLCKSMSVPFYIWQVQRTEPDYQYDNQSEFDSMKDMFALYQASEEECQFKDQISGLFAKIEANYKYGQGQKTTVQQK